MTRRDLLDVFAITAAVGALVWFAAGPVAQAQPTGQPRGPQFACSADDIGATLTLLTGCLAPSDGFSRRYVTDIVSQSTTTTGGTYILRYGTSVQSGGSANCATGTTSLIPSAATAARLSSPANTAASGVINLSSPLIVPPNKDLCVLGVGTNTTSIQITGYVAP